VRAQKMGCSTSPQKPVSYAFYTLGAYVKLSLCTLEVVVVVHKKRKSHHNCSPPHKKRYTLPSSNPHTSLLPSRNPLSPSLQISSHQAPPQPTKPQTLPLKSSPIQA